MACALNHQFEIKPALLATPRIYEVRETDLVCLSPEGELLWQLALPQVQQAAFVDHQVKGSRFWRFDLVAGGERQSISLTLPPGGASGQPDLRVFVDLITLLCQRLSQVRPDLQVVIGEYGRWRVLWFAMGVFSMVSGLGILALALIDGVSVDKLMGASLALGLLVLLGAGLCTAYAPWRKPPQIPAEQLAKTLGSGGATEN